MRIEELREPRKLTRAELGDISGVDARQIAAYELNAIWPGPEITLALPKPFGSNWANPLRPLWDSNHPESLHRGTISNPGSTPKGHELPQEAGSLRRHLRDFPQLRLSRLLSRRNTLRLYEQSRDWLRTDNSSGPLATACTGRLTTPLANRSTAEALLLGISFWMLRFSFLTRMGTVLGWRCLW